MGLNHDPPPEEMAWLFAPSGPLGMWGLPSQYWVDGWLDGQTDGQTDGQMDEWMGGLMDVGSPGKP